MGAVVGLVAKEEIPNVIMLVAIQMNLLLHHHHVVPNLSLCLCPLD